MCTEFEPVLHMGQGQYGYKFADPSLVNKRVPDLGLNPCERTTQTAIPTLSPSVPSSLPQQLQKGEIDAHGAVTLTLLGRLPTIIEVAILDWPPFGLGVRFATLYAAAIWHMVISFKSGNPSIVRLYTLITIYLPALVLHDSRTSTQHLLPDQTALSHRGTVLSRIKNAEAGEWNILIEDLLQAHRDRDPNKEAKEAIWTTRCARAAQRSLAGGWNMAFRALQTDPCPTPCKETFDKVAEKFYTNPIEEQAAATFEILRSRAFKTVTQKTGESLTLKKVDKRLRCLKKAAQPGLARARNTHLYSLLKAPYGKQAVRLWALAWIRGEVPQEAVDLWFRQTPK